MREMQLLWNGEWHYGRRHETRESALQEAAIIRADLERAVGYAEGNRVKGLRTVRRAGLHPRLQTGQGHGKGGYLPAVRSHVHGGCAVTVESSTAAE
jgi:hypothetical protein